MKYIFILSLIMISCALKNSTGEETVKVSNTLKVKTVAIDSEHYPIYKKGDSVIVWKVKDRPMASWHIETSISEIHENDLIYYNKGVIE